MTDWRNTLLIAALILTPIGCAAINRIEPVKRPPAAFQQSRPVLVEFVSPELVTLRCAQRGAIGAMACADTDKISIANPCATNESYARTLCHELAHANGWKD